jgi:hypothetical protein
LGANNVVNPDYISETIDALNPIEYETNLFVA